jgi:hypothetical protein
MPAAHWPATAASSNIFDITGSRRYGINLGVTVML